MNKIEKISCKINASLSVYLCTDVQVTSLLLKSTCLLLRFVFVFSFQKKISLEFWVLHPSLPTPLCLLLSRYPVLPGTVGQSVCPLDVAEEVGEGGRGGSSVLLAAGILSLILLLVLLFLGLA